MCNTKDDFPVLVRRDGAGNGTKLSASSAALDLALSQSPGPDAQSTGWNGYRHRQAQQSLPANTFRKASQMDEYESGRPNGNAENTPKNNRRSVEFNFSPKNNESKRSSYTGPTNGMPKLTQSYSTNDVPTLKNGVNGANSIGFTHSTTTTLVWVVFRQTSYPTVAAEISHLVTASLSIVLRSQACTRVLLPSVQQSLQVLPTAIVGFRQLSVHQPCRSTLVFKPPTQDTMDMV